MPAENPHEWLIEALYGERDDHALDGSPGRDDLDEAQRAEVAAYETLLEEMRPALRDYAPRAHVSESIRQAARKHAEALSHELPARRQAPGALASPSTTLWARARRGGVVQLVALLTVCLGAGLIASLLLDREVDSNFGAAPSAVNEEVKFFAEAQEQIEAQPVEVTFEEEVADTDEQEEQLLALQDEMKEPDDLEIANKGSEPAMELALNERSQRRPSREEKPSMKRAKRSSRSAPKQSKRKAKSAPYDSVDSLFGAMEGDSEESSSAPPSSRGASAETAAAPSAPSRLESDSEGSSATLQRAERAYGRQDYAQTLDDSDAYLERGVGTNKERARALELKALALQALGRGSEAEGVFETIRERYPDYYRKQKVSESKRRSEKKTEMEFDDSSPV